MLLNLFPVLAIGYWIYVLITGQIDTIPPQSHLFDYLFVYPFWISILVMIQSLMFIIPADLIRLIFFPFYKKSKDRWNKYIAYYTALITCVFLIYVPARIIYDYNSVEISDYEYVSEDVTESLDGFKITLMADMQADHYTDESRLEKFIETVNSTDPDLILIAGDMITNTPLYIDLAAEYIGRLHAEYGVYSCVGDHDNWAYRSDTKKSLREITSALNKFSVPMIDNENRIIKVNSDSIGVTFITNTYVERVPVELMEELTSANHVDFKIFLTHQPREYLIKKAHEKNYNLYFAGHTHGGQITFLFPFFNPSVTHIETHYVKGDFWFDDMMMVVTGGLGMSLAPIRYNSTPDVSVITLRKK